MREPNRPFDGWGQLFYISGHRWRARHDRPDSQRLPDALRAGALGQARIPLAMLRQVRLPFGLAHPEHAHHRRPEFDAGSKSLRWQAGVDEFGLRMARARWSYQSGAGRADYPRPAHGQLRPRIRCSRYIHIHHEGMRLAIRESGRRHRRIVLFLRGRTPARAASIGRDGARHRLPRDPVAVRRRVAAADRSSFCMNPPPRNPLAYYREVLQVRRRLQFRIRTRSLLPARMTWTGRFRRAHPLIARYVRKHVVDEFDDATQRDGTAKIGQLDPHVAAGPGDCSIERVADHLATTAAPSTGDSRIAARRSPRCSIRNAPISSFT